MNLNLKRRGLKRKTYSHINAMKYLTVVALEENLQMYFTKSGTIGKIFVSSNNGRSWTEVESGELLVISKIGGKLLFKGYDLTINSSSGIGYFTFDKKCSLCGNCMSMIYGDDVDNYNSVPSYAFSGLFKNCTTIINVSKDFLPATTVAYQCYYYMFSGCTSLINTPELPAMTLATYCYSNMFSGCTSLVYAPKLPAMTLATYCYSNMFYRCSSLTNAPELPATTLVNYCYYCMFYNCTSLTNAPELPATTLTRSCYFNMFYGCTNLQYVKALFTTTPSSSYTSSWLQGVSPTGIFIKNNNATWTTTGSSAVPTNWTVQSVLTSNEVKNSKYMGIEALEDDLRVSISGNTIQYSCDNGNNWETLEPGQKTKSAKKGEILWFKAYGLTPTSSMGIGTFYITKRCNLVGNCMSLLYGDYADNVTNISHDYAFAYLFSKCNTIVNVDKNFLPATTLTNYCYRNMFSSCTSLTTAPELPATTLAINCYTSMFQNCTGLIAAPELPATTLVGNCYSSMFRGCSSLTTAPELPATTLATYCYYYMFYGCTGLTAAPELPATTLATYCYYYMFYGCTGLKTASKLPATTLATSCYDFMFSGCTSLAYAPELPAVSVSSSSYKYMFSGCSNLKYVRALFTNTPNNASSNSFSYNWLKDVASTGTFIKNPNATWDANILYGASTVPSGWTIKSTTQDTQPTIEANKAKYVTFEVLNNGFSLALTNTTNKIDYSIDGGITWSTLNPNEYTPMLAKGVYVMVRSNSTSVSITSNGGIGTFVLDGGCNIYGNILALLYKDNANLYTDSLIPEYAFKGLFNRCTSIVNVSKNFLPATNLASNCYGGMFRGCTNLKTAPELPATTLADNCYSNMFQGCSNLKTSPALPATTLADNCYANMFSSCTGLKTAPELPATTLADNCYANMLSSCTSLTAAPALPATTLADYCYYYMLSGCTGLIAAPELPATTLAPYCYSNMFSSCTSLTTAPVLPATTLASNCYSNMFGNCTSLTTAPELPATTLASNCYYNLFRRNTIINKIKMLAKENYTANCFTSWQPGTSYGLFIKNSLNNAISDYKPYNWDVISETQENYLTMIPLEDGFTVTIYKDTSDERRTKIEYSIDACKTWMELSAGESTPAINVGETISFKSHFATSYSEPGKFVINKQFNLAGNVLSLIYGDNASTNNSLYGHEGIFYRLFANTKVVRVHDDFLPSTTLSFACYREMFSSCEYLVKAPKLPATTLASQCYSSMFSGCTSLTTAPELPATTLVGNCYSGMFKNCISLTSAPELPATTLANHCYYSMFSGCTSLTTAPELPATVLADYCYGDMFSSCTSLTTAPVLPATTLASNCYEYMFGNCTSLTTAPVLSAMELANNCYSSMFAYCTSLTTAPELPAPTLADYCYEYMFNGCTNLLVAPTFPTPYTTLSLAPYCYSYMFSGCTKLTVSPKIYATTLVEGCCNYMFEGCTSLNYIFTNFTTSPSTTYTRGWIEGVTTRSGMFIYNNNASWSISNLAGQTYGIPSSWKIYRSSDSIPAEDRYLTIEALEDGLTASLSRNNIEYSTDNGLTWTTLAAGTTTNAVNTGEKLMFRGSLTPVTNNTSTGGIGRFTISKQCNLSGNCSSLLNCNSGRLSNIPAYAFNRLFYNCTTINEVSDNFLSSSSLGNYAYYYMFYGCTSLVSAPELPVTTLATNCYSYMFYDCTSLVSAPELPATTLAVGCYNNMFNGCTSLTTAPELPATTLVNSCYGRMFNRCTKLNYVKALFTTTPSASYTSYWLSGVGSGGTFVCSDSATWKDTITNGVSTVPSGWTIITESEEDSGSAAAVSEIGDWDDENTETPNNE